MHAVKTINLTQNETQSYLNAHKRSEDDHDKHISPLKFYLVRIEFL